MAGSPAPQGPLPEGRWFVDVEKMLQGEYWTNRYVVNGPDLAAATQSGLSIATIERTTLHTSVLFVKVRVSDGRPDTDVYSISNLNYFGQRATNTELLPLFNVARVDFNTGNEGRPSRKYLRGVLAEQDIAFNALGADIVAHINTNYSNPLAAFTPYVDIDGQEITSGAVYPFVGMRQLRRGSKRKAPVPNPPTGT